ncbi:MAG: flagellar protein FlaG [Lachnospiraceae bacterium]|nr:flagellar protein FlaG [Lachnospiraceae bacterium]
MALDGIGGVGSINVATTIKPQQPKQTTDIHVESTATTASGNQIQVETRPVVSKDDPKKQDGKGFQKNAEDKDQVQKKEEVTPEKVKDAVDDINKKIRQANPLHHTACSFKYHDDTNRISITVKNTDTDEVIREIPAEKALDMLAKAWELAGLMVDEKR